MPQSSIGSKQWKNLQSVPKKWPLEKVCFCSAWASLKFQLGPFLNSKTLPKAEHYSACQHHQHHPPPHLTRHVTGQVGGQNLVCRLRLKTWKTRGKGWGLWNMLSNVQVWIKKMFWGFKRRIVLVFKSLSFKKKISVKQNIGVQKW